MPRSVMEHSFSQVPTAEIPRSSFNRSHGLKTTFDADYLVPILVDEVVPGDTFNVNTTFFCRLASPTLFPLMDNLFMDVFYFYVPNRLLWTNWEKFLGAQDNPADSIDYSIPTSNASGSAPALGSLADYMGLPLVTNAYQAASVLPFRAYALIYNEWFRDQNLQDSVALSLADGADSTTSAALLKRGKKHDYFTSCLPWPQKQTTGVSLPLGTSADIHTTLSGGGAPEVYSEGSSDFRRLVAPSPVPSWVTVDTVAGVSDSNKLFADLSTATAATVNDLREAFQVQRLLERDARSGTRMVETIKAHFGVTVPDFRAQRPEFLGGGSHAVNVTPVGQTTYQGTATLKDSKGALAGTATISGQNGFTKSFVEHGLIIGLANLRGDITYSQGLERYWSKSTRYDFYYPVLAHLGEQAVLNKEIYFNNDANDDLVFGYQERWAEMRYKPSRLTNLMRTGVSGTLEAWHLSENFSSLPTLGDTFIQSNTGTPLDRAVAVSSEPHVIADFYFDMKCARPMPTYSVPGMLDHL